MNINVTILTRVRLFLQTDNSLSPLIMTVVSSRQMMHRLMFQNIAIKEKPNNQSDAGCCHVTGSTAIASIYRRLNGFINDDDYYIILLLLITTTMMMMLIIKAIIKYGNGDDNDKGNDDDEYD